MESKLTLKLNKDIISWAKEYARSHDLSLSKIVESYFKTLASQTDVKEDEDELTPFVKSFRTGIKVPLDEDCKNVFTDYMEMKYK